MRECRGGCELTSGTKLVGNKRVFLVTDNDKPPGSDVNRAPARTVYGDLLTYGITINTFFINRPGSRFDPTGFWNVRSCRDALTGRTC
jgi:ATP-dependent DNA helicase 2 subunit 1